MTTLPDAPLAGDVAARETCLDPGESILLQAPAGSGKTEVLTQRFLSLLASVDEPEEILALTFTRKAAAEMRRRVLRVLDGAFDPARPTAPTLSRLREAALRRAAQRGWDRDELHARLRIQTLDSLNHELVAAMPLGNRPLPGAQVSDDPMPLYLEAARLTLHDAEADPAFGPAIDRVLRRLDNRWEQAERLIAAMLACRQQWLRPVLERDPDALAAAVQRGLESVLLGALGRCTAALGADRLSSVEAVLRGLAQRRHEAGEPVGGASWACWLEAGVGLRADPRQLRAWQAFAEFALTQGGDWRQRLTVREGFPPAFGDAKRDALELLGVLSGCDGLRDQLQLVPLLPFAELGSEERLALDALAQVIRLAAAELRLVFDRAGRFDHTEVATRALDALSSLGSPSELAMRRAAALRHLLVDEFQDISTEQWRLLEHLVLGWENGDGRSFFAVGDPMQSIYLFRNAEVGLFLRAREQGIGDLRLRCLQLRRNFRSHPVLIDWCNSTFSRVFPGTDDIREAAVSFLAASPGLADAAAGAEVRVHPAETDDADAEAASLAAEAAAARARDPAASIAVLLRTRTQAAPILRALRAAGLAARGVDLESLAAQLVVRDIVALARALMHPGDRAAWFAVLHAPYCGLRLGDLDALARATGPRLLSGALQDPEVVAAISPDARARLGRCAPLLAEAVANRDRGRFTALLRSTWEALGAPAALASDAELETAVAFFATLSRSERQAALLDGDAIEALAGSTRVGGAPAGEGGPGAAVEVLTIHAAKGLEWDVVLLPGLHRRTAGDRSRLLSWIELARPDRDVDLLMAPLSLGRKDPQDRLGRYIAHLHKRKQAHESARLAYVAVTRARRELHLFAHAARPHKASLLHLLWPAVGTRFAPREQGEAPGGEIADARAPVRPPVVRVLSFRRLPSDWRATVGVTEVPIQRLRVGSEGEAALPAVEFAWVGPTRRAIGTVVHAELERLATGGAVAGVDRAAREPAWRARLAELGVSGDALDRSIDAVAGILDRTARDPVLAWILSPAHREAVTELRLSGIVDGALRDIVVDRSFVDADGTRWVVDYKTGTHQGAGLEEFIAHELDRYRPQLELYRRMVASLGPQPVRAALYFPLLGRLAEAAAPQG